MISRPLQRSIDRAMAANVARCDLPPKPQGFDRSAGRHEHLPSSARQAAPVQAFGPTSYNL